MKHKIGAFTLVEIIVVITILAILGTIGFLGFQGYSTDARNSKRTLDLSNLSNLILIKETEGLLPNVFVGGNDENKIDGGFINVGGQASDNDTYDAGIINYRGLDIVKSKFMDPNNIDEYRIGATTTYGGRFELATSLEVGSVKESFIKGNYYARGNDSATVESISSNAVTLSVNDSNKFKARDRIETNSGAEYDIVKVARDSRTVIFDTDMTGTTSIQLVLPETEGLLASKDDSSVILLTESQTTLPY